MSGYIYNVKLDCEREDMEPFWAEFSVIAESKTEALKKAKEIADRKGYILRWVFAARDPVVVRKI